MAASKIKVGIVGGSGYVGLELLRLLLAHPEVQVCKVTSRENAGKKLYELHPGLLGLSDLSFSAFGPELSNLDLVYICVPHTESMQIVKSLSEAANPKLRIIDLGTDFRLNAQQFTKWYGKEHIAQELLGLSIFGTPELTPHKVAKAALVANPGCFAHCSILALAPLAKAGALKGEVKISAVTGSSGSGISPTKKTHHPERNDSYSAYNVLKHRHIPEIENTLTLVSGSKNQVKVALVPQSGPFTRGIFATCFAEISDPNLDVQALYAAFAEEHFFYRVRPETPRLLDVRGTNFCDVSVIQNGSQVIVLSAIDNLTKGASGNAVQCMNLMFGLDENAGLKNASL